MPVWLDQVNIIRGMANLPPLTEDPALSQADYALAKYEVENLSTISHLAGQNDNPNFTAAQNSDIWGSLWAGIPVNEANIVNQWGLSVFHGLQILDPRLKKVGFGSYSDPPANALTAISWSGGLVTATTTTAHGVQVGQPVEISGVTPSGYNGTYKAASGTTGSTLVYALTANPGTETGLGTLSRPLKAVAALNVQQGLDPGAPFHEVSFPAPQSFTMATTYPNELPDARSSCGYNAQAGLPISYQFGAGKVEGDSAGSSLAWDPDPSQPGTQVEVCVINEHNYNNPDPALQSLGRQILAYRGAVVLLPRAPLAAGQYTVNVRPTNHEIKVWNFNVVHSMTIPAKPAE
jgi:hypothetical protein